MLKKTAITAGALLILITNSMAQERHPPQERGNDNKHSMWMCNTTEPLYVKRLMHIEYAVVPKAGQLLEFEALKEAARKAYDFRRSGCPSDDEKRDQSPIGRMNVHEKMLAANLEALRIYKPAFAAFYSKLDDAQKDRLRWMEHNHHSE